MSQKRNAAKAKTKTYLDGLNDGFERGYASAMQELSYLLGKEDFTGPTSTPKGRHRRQAISEAREFLEMMGEYRKKRRAWIGSMEDRLRLAAEKASRLDDTAPREGV